MNSLVNKAVSAAHNKLGQLNELLNGTDPRFVSHREYGKDKKIENLNLNSKHCHSYIGKMKIDGSGTYSDDVITALLKYFFDHTNKGEKVVIELANKVSELLNGEESMNGNMNYEEQKKHILELAKKLSKKRTNDLEIVDIQDNNKRLFEVLEKEGIKGLLDGYIGIPDFQKSFDSLDIAQYLYRVAKVNFVYSKEIKNLKSEELKQMSGDSDYYGLIEMAIRINALLHGITLQGGVARQKKYDALLLKHINPYANDLPMLHDFQKNCRDYLKGETFKGLYFDTDNSKLYVNKLDSKKQLQSKTRNALLLALGIGVGVLGNGYLQSQKQKKANQETIKEIFENKKVGRWGDMGGGYYNGKEKLDRINEYTQRIYDRYVFRFGSTGNFNEEQFKSKILNCLNNQKLLDDFGVERTSDNMALDDVIIDDYLIPQNISEFSMNKLPMRPYAHLVPYTAEFINTVLADEDFEVKADSTEEMFDGKRGFPLIEYQVVKDIGSFSSKGLGWKSGFRFYKYRLATTTHNNKKQIVASFPYVGEPDTKRDNILSSERARYLALDFLEQTNPILNLLIEQYLTRYQSLEVPNRSNADGPEKRSISADLELFLVREFFKKGLFEKLGGDININNKQERIVEINKFLDQLAIDKSGFLKKYNGDINPNLIPNGFFQQYEDAMENVIKNGDDIDSRLPVTDWGKNNTVDHIGRYQSSDGKMYNVGFAEKDGKRYLLADEIGSPNYGKTTYGPREGEIVAIDYMKQAKPMIKELLNIFSIRYFGGKKISEKESLYSSYIPDFDIKAKMEEWIVKDFVSKGMLEKIGGHSIKGNEAVLISYIDKFVLQELAEFKKLSHYDDKKTNLDMIPNRFLSGYELAMKNTIRDKDQIQDKNKGGGSVDKIIKKIGLYISSKGVKYMVWETDIDGKSYICAEKEGERNSLYKDVISCGDEVAEDYFKVKAKLLQDQILLEKKLKSASQRHVNPPRK